jgi:hypothetical protein
MSTSLHERRRRRRCTRRPERHATSRRDPPCRRRLIDDLLRLLDGIGAPVRGAARGSYKERERVCVCVVSACLACWVGQVAAREGKAN